MVTARVRSKKSGRLLDILWVFLVKKKLFHSHLLVWDDYSQLGVTRLVGYLPSHIQSALVE